MAKKRLDVLLFEKGLCESRERAKTTIMSGVVFVDGQRADKPGTPVSEDSEIEVRGAALEYVSRGGLKLEKALREFSVSPEGRICIDCGASTGGFTDCLLKGGAVKVYAHSDVRRLAVNGGHYAAGQRVKTVLGLCVTNILYDFPGDLLKLDVALGCQLSHYAAQAGRDAGLAGNTA